MQKICGPFAVPLVQPFLRFCGGMEAGVPSSLGDPKNQSAQSKFREGSQRSGPPSRSPIYESLNCKSGHGQAIGIGIWPRTVKMTVLVLGSIAEIPMKMP